MYLSLCHYICVLSQIFGPGKKLGHLILFTMCLLIIASSISLQLFCNIRDFDKFGRFDQVSPVNFVTHFLSQVLFLGTNFK